MSLPAYEDFEVSWPADGSETPDLICPRCNGPVVEVEHRDTLGTLVRCAEDHLLSCAGAS